MKRLTNILVIIVYHYPASTYSPGLGGLAKYSSLFGPWQFQVAEYHEWIATEPPPNLVTDRYDGALIFNPVPTIESIITKIGLPAVGIVGVMHRSSLPLITPDDYQVGVLGAQHLMQGFFEHFAFLGINESFSVLREKGFTETLLKAGRSMPATLSQMMGGLMNWRQTYRRELLRQWLIQLPKPIAVMACNDAMGAMLLQECHDLEIRVPRDVAVLGVDNVAWYCETAPTALSSIDRNTDDLAYRAASLLDRLMQGKKPPVEAILIPPGGVTQRRSTEVIYREHPDLDAAIRFIRDHACDGITIADVEKHVLLSRRSLHRMFKKFRGNSPGDEIRQHRLERARRLLLETDLNLAEISSRCCFGSLTYLGRAFRQKHGVPPSIFREKYRRK